MLRKNQIFVKLVTIIIFSDLLVSCTLKPEKITDNERVQNVKGTLEQLHVADMKQGLKIDLRRAISLAINNNLEYRLKKVQSALAYKQYDLAKTEMYPNVNLSMDYNHRNRDYIKTLGDAGGGDSDAQSLIPHSLKTGSVVFNWDILDFGLSYVRAKQAADRYMLSLEQRKQMAATIINDVIKNYTLAYYGQELKSQIKEIEDAVSESLKVIDSVLEQEAGDNKQLLSYKKTLVEDYREAKGYLTYFNQSRDKLLNLINFNSKAALDDIPLQLEAPDQYLLKLPALKSDLLYLDTIALFFRPELLESMYKLRETEKQKTVAVLERLPSFGFNLGYNYDSDKYLKFQNWWSDNLSIAWNLLHMATIPAAVDTVETQLEAAKLTHLASSAVILGEVRVLLYNYKMKKYDYHLAEKESEFATNIYNHTLNLVTSGLGDEQALVGDKITSLNSELSKLRTFVDARNLFEDLILALGLYNYGGEYIKHGHVDFNIVNKWIDNFNNKEFDSLIGDEYKIIENTYQLSKTSKHHKAYKEEHGSGHTPMQKKPDHEGKPDKPKANESEEHAKLELNLPKSTKIITGPTYHRTLFSKLGNYFSSLMG